MDGGGSFLAMSRIPYFVGREILESLGLFFTAGSITFGAELPDYVCVSISIMIGTFSDTNWPNDAIKNFFSVKRKVTMVQHFVNKLKASVVGIVGVA